MSRKAFRGSRRDAGDLFMPVAFANSYMKPSTADDIRIIPLLGAVNYS